MTNVMRLKGFGRRVLGLAVLVALMAICVGILTGAAAFSVWVLKWTFSAFLIILLVSVVLLAPLALIPPARGFSARGFKAGSYAFSAILWIWGMSYTYVAWGMAGVFLGLVLLGIGAVPLAMVAALMHGDWSSLLTFILTAVLAVGFHMLASWLEEKADERAARLSRADIAVKVYQIPE